MTPAAGAAGAAGATEALADDEARRDIADALDQTLFVEAGAGTGKTHALVQRVVNLVARGTPLTAIAAITFTEAAAADLRDRVRIALDDEARMVDDHDHAGSSGGEGAAVDAGERARRCAEAVAAFDDATISTLHGFAQRVLTEFPVEAGLPPGFEVLDEIQALLGFAEQWRAHCDAMFEDAELAPALRSATILGLTTRHLETIARGLARHWDRCPRLGQHVEMVPPFDAAPVIAHLECAIAVAPQCRMEGDTLLTRLGDLQRLVEQLHDADAQERLELLAETGLAAGNRGRRAHWPDDTKAQVVAALDAAEAARVEAVEAVRRPAFATLLARLSEFVHATVEVRRRDGRLEFHDLLVHARDLLRSVPEVRHALHQRYRHVLLDEFQDTDPLQIEIAVLIATDDSDVSEAWWECSIPGGRLFVVGDPKQSIYRFRRADIELYHRVRELFATAGSIRTLVTNFRSRPGILDFVNEAFTPLMAPGDVLQATYEALTPRRGADAASPEPVRTFGGAEPRDTDLAELRRREAHEVVALVLQARDEGWAVHDDREAEDHTRPARLADIAILLPTRATLPYLEDALGAAAVPARIESRSLVFATAEVQELLSVLTALDDPADEVAIVAALRSPGFACRDDELVEFALAGGRFDYRFDGSPALDPEHSVPAGLRRLRALHERRWWDDIGSLVDRVVSEQRLLELAVGRTRPRDHWRRTRFVAEAARAYCDAGGTSLRGFLDWARLQLDEEASVLEIVVPEPDDDAVRILTVHGAKGLEFPIVVLSGLGLREQGRADPVLFSPDGIEVRVGREKSRFMTDGFEALAVRERDAQSAEQTRVLYVAATRARDHLAVSLYHREQDHCLAARIAGHARGPAMLGAPPSEPGRSVGSAGPATAAARPPTPLSSTVAQRDAWLRERIRCIDAARRESSVAATALAARARDAAPEARLHDPNLDKDAAEYETPAWRRGRAGTAVGRAVHAVLQSVDVVTGEGVARAARAQALAEGIPEREPEVRELAESLLRAPVLRQAVDEGWPRWREVPVAAEIDGVLVEGFIDLLVRAPEGLVVVDYKTDHVPASHDLDAALAHYRIQGAAYALALEQVLGERVARCVFVFARSGDPLEREVTDLDAAQQDVRAQLAS